MAQLAHERSQVLRGKVEALAGAESRLQAQEELVKEVEGKFGK